MALVRLLVNSVLVLAIIAGALLGFITYRLAQLPYNSEGRYFDGVVVTHESAPVAYGFLCAVAFVIAGIALLLRRFLERRNETT